MQRPSVIPATLAPALALALALSPLRAQAASMTAPHTARSGHKPVVALPHPRLIAPDRSIDPGMKIIAPKMPSGSSAVLHPPRATPDGTVIVPK